MRKNYLTLILIFLAPSVHADYGDCGSMTYWDNPSAMCMPLAMSGMNGNEIDTMLHGNGFLVGTTEAGPRGRNALSGPDMLMGDFGRHVNEKNYLNLELMLTGEKWFYPDRGYPELLQQGEANNNGLPFIDAQHPHSSPIMGLTLSDTYWLGEGTDHFKFSFAPRGESTDGPIAFMHRETGMANPDAPLGHHLGQDVGHISSTVVAGELSLGKNIFEFSGFNGTEPQPEKVDLPIGSVNSFGLRYSRLIGEHWLAMGSFAYVKDPEGADLNGVIEIPYVMRYSSSIYFHEALTEDLTLEYAFIFGAITQYDHAPSLFSLDDEFVLQRKLDHLFWRLEVLQRTPAQLQVTTLSDSNRGDWVSALTIGYAHQLWAMGDNAQLSLGVSGTKDFLPQDYQSCYGGNPWTGKVFLQLTGMKMNMHMQM